MPGPDSHSKYSLPGSASVSGGRTRGRDTSPVVYADDQFYLQRIKHILQPLQQQSAISSLSNGTGSWTIADASASASLSPVQLLDHVFIGSQRNADSLLLLRQLGITHVLNCAGLRRYDFTRSPYHKDTGIKGFLMFPAEDHEDYDIKRHFADALAFLDDVKRCRGRALVHCNLGVNRSGAIVAAYLMASERRTLLDVIQFLRSRRSLILSNKGFRRQLIAFARELGLLDPVISVQTDDVAEQQQQQQYVDCDGSTLNNGWRTRSPSTHRSTPSVVVSCDAATAPCCSDDEAGHHWTLRPQQQQQQQSNSLSPLYEQRDDAASTSSGGLGGFLTTLIGRRRPLRSTSFSNVSTTTCSSNSSTTASPPAAAAAGTSSTAAGELIDEPRTLSTSRPLRVYTRSSTDSVLYRRAASQLPPRPPPPAAVQGTAGTVQTTQRQKFPADHGRTS